MRTLILWFKKNVFQSLIILHTFNDIDHNNKARASHNLHIHESKGESKPF